MTSSSPAENKKRKRLFNILKFLIFLGIGIFFVYWFLLKLSPEQKDAIWQSFLGARWGWVALVMLSSIVAHFIRALRWRLLFKPLGHIPSVNNTFGAVMVTYLANLAFPRLGEVMRCAMLRTSERIPMEKSIGTVVTERLFDILMFAVVILLGFLLMFSSVKDFIYDSLSQKFSTLPTLAVIATAGVILLVILFVLFKLFHERLLKFKPYKKIIDLISGCIDGVKSILHLGPKSTVLFLLYSATIYFLYIVGGWLILKAFGDTQTLGFQTAFVIYLFGSVGMMISQGGLGAYPVLVWQALVIYGVGETTGLACGWLLWGSQQAIVIVVGLAFLIYFSLLKNRDK
ncbi:MAG: flippase-like domain-containing protein [Bacteroidales bacterium]|nr:flippase-like domain-containing protein [Bacteroidales bacterium]